jgi:hypothetical protein
MSLCKKCNSVFIPNLEDDPIRTFDHTWKFCNDCFMVKNNIKNQRRVRKDFLPDIMDACEHSIIDADENCFFMQQRRKRLGIERIDYKCDLVYPRTFFLRIK